MKGSSVIRFLIIALAVVFLGNQVFAAVYKPIETQTAVYHTATDGIKITGLIIRNENLIQSNTQGVMHFMIEDGNRVANGGVIANIYGSESASITVSEIESVKSRITDIEDILSYNDIDAANLELVNSKVQNSLNDFIFSVSAGNYNSASQNSHKLLSSINRKQVAMGSNVDFASQLEALKKQLDSLSAKLPDVKGEIKADCSGYFVSQIDGYEKVLNIDDLSSVTPEFLENVKPKKTNDEFIGKIVSDYEWYIAATVSVDESLKFKEGEALKLATSVKSSPELNATVKKINISEDFDTAVMIFSCNEMNKELAVMRSGPMTVIKKQYSGLKIPRKALRVVDGVRGVYVVNGMQINFVPIEIIYSTEEYIICKKQSDNSGVLRLYDSVVVKGRQLYDGKIIG